MSDLREIEVVDDNHEAADQRDDHFVAAHSHPRYSTVIEQLRKAHKHMQIKISYNAYERNFVYILADVCVRDMRVVFIPVTTSDININAKKGEKTEKKNSRRMRNENIFAPHCRLRGWRGSPC